MGDLLVKLYDLPSAENAFARLESGGYRIHRPLSPDRERVCQWVRRHFGDRWSSETEMAFSGHPVTCFVARNEEGEIAGFANYDTSFRGFFGPTGVRDVSRGKGIGTALLFRTLEAMRDAGYAYAIIGYSGADQFYRDTVGAVPIEGSEPGAYRDLLRGEK